MTLGEKLFDPGNLYAGENDVAAEARVERTRKIFRECLDTPQGRKLLNILTQASPPYAPRFSGDFDPIKAAQADGEKNLIGLLVINGGNPKL